MDKPKPRRAGLRQQDHNTQSLHGHRFPRPDETCAKSTFMKIPSISIPDLSPEDIHAPPIDSSDDELAIVAKEEIPKSRRTLSRRNSKTKSEDEENESTRILDESTTYTQSKTVPCRQIQLTASATSRPDWGMMDSTTKKRKPQRTFGAYKSGHRLARSFKPPSLIPEMGSNDDDDKHDDHGDRVQNPTTKATIPGNEQRPAFRAPVAPKGLERHIEIQKPKFNLPNPPLRRSTRSTSHVDAASHQDEEGPRKAQVATAKFRTPLDSLNITNANRSADKASSLDMPEKWAHVMQDAADQLGVDIKDINENLGADLHVAPPSSDSSSTSVFNASDLGDKIYGSPRGVKSSQSSLLSSPASPEKTSKAQCPVCKADVDRLWLESLMGVGPVRMRKQADICRAHQFKTAEESWSSRGYPEIDWQSFQSRLFPHHDILRQVLENERSSVYRNAMQKLCKTGTSRTLKQIMLGGQNVEGLSPGYYGPRGAKLMNDHIIEQFAPRLRDLAASNKLIATIGISGYVQAILVPELATLLVMADMHVDESRAQAILRESANMGNLLNEEVD